MTAATTLSPSASSRSPSASSRAITDQIHGRKLQCDAVVKYLRTEEDDIFHFRWRRCNDQGRWLAPPADGDITELQSALADSQSEICLLLPGNVVITKRMAFSAKERKHLRRLIPYELEDEVTAEIDDLHFAFGAVADDEVDVAYVDRTLLQDLLATLTAANIEVMYCLPESLLMPRLENGWALRLTDQLDVRYSDELGFAVDWQLAGPALTALCQSAPLPQHVLLLAEDQSQLQQLRDSLPPVLRDELTSEQIDIHLADEWDSLALDQASALDLRQGEFARRLPLGKWAREWRSVAVMGAVALVAYVVVNVGQIQLFKSGQAKLLEQQVAVARQVIPQGQISDPQKQIAAQLAKYGTSTGTSNVVQLLSLIAPVIDSAQNVDLGQVSYIDQSGAMNLTLEADSPATIERLRDELTKKQLRVDPPSMNQRGDKYQARLIVKKDLL